MKTINLDQLNIEELTHQQMVETEGGTDCGCSYGLLGYVVGTVGYLAATLLGLPHGGGSSNCGC